MQRLQVLQGFVGRELIDAPRASAKSYQEQRNEHQIERDKRDPEMKLGENFIHHAAEHLGEPEVDSRETAEEYHREQRVMKVCDDKVGAVHHNIDCRRAKKNPGYSADEKGGDAA